MELDDKDVVRLGSCSEDETDSLTELFNWKMEDYEIFQPSCHILEVIEMDEESYSSIDMLHYVLR